MLVELLKAEDACREKARESEEEVSHILNDRIKEEVASDLDISVYDTDRNEKARRHREELVGACVVRNTVDPSNFAIQHKNVKFHSAFRKTLLGEDISLLVTGY